MPNIVINKPWGQETILTQPDLPYVAKIIHLNQAGVFSLQYHDKKLETITLYQGQARITLGNSPSTLKTEPMIENIGYTIHPGLYHQIEAISDCLIFEASTPEIGTTTRVQDKYNRPNETEDVRNLPNRGWSGS